MTRRHVRVLKRSVRGASRPEALEADKTRGAQGALELLDRSVRFGHGRLAVLRLEQAVRSGANVPLEHWKYCYTVAMTSEDGVLQLLYLQAAQRKLTLDV